MVVRDKQLQSTQPEFIVKVHQAASCPDSHPHGTISIDKAQASGAPAVSTITGIVALAWRHALSPTVGTTFGSQFSTLDQSVLTPPCQLLWAPRAKLLKANKLTKTIIDVRFLYIDLPPYHPKVPKKFIYNLYMLSVHR
jgi:hypothetical protein